MNGGLSPESGDCGCSNSAVIWIVVIVITALIVITLLVIIIVVLLLKIHRGKQYV